MNTVVGERKGASGVRRISAPMADAQDSVQLQTPEHSPPVVRKLLLGASAALAAIVVIGLGDGDVAEWFRAIGGGAAVGYAMSVLRHAAPGDNTVGDVARHFGGGTLIFICAFAVGGATVNLFARDQRLDREAREEVVDFIVGQGFWAGEPSVRDSTVREFGQALRENSPPTVGTESPRQIGVTEAITRAAAENENRLAVEGIVCSRYALVTNDVTESLHYDYTYRLISPGGRDELHVVSAGDYGTIARGATVRVTGVLAATGPRRNSPARNTAFLLGLTDGEAQSAASSPRTDQLCSDTP